MYKYMKTNNKYIQIIIMTRLDMPGGISDNAL